MARTAGPGGLLALALALGACSLELPRPYTLEIQQGTVLDQKMLSRLRPGMTRNQVGLALGTPLLTDPLHADRWDYVYYTRHRGEVGDWRRLTLTFKDDRLAQITGDVTVAAAGAEGAAALPAPGQAAPGLPAASGLPATPADTGPVAPGLPATPPDAGARPASAPTSMPAPGGPAVPPAETPNGPVPQ